MEKTLKSKYLHELSYDERISLHLIQIEELKELKQIESYFKYLRGTRNHFIVEIRKTIADQLLARGFSVSEIGRVIHRHHSTVLHLRKLNNNEYIKKVVKENYKHWIENLEYPVTRYYYVPATLRVPGENYSALNYEVKKIKI